MNRTFNALAPVMQIRTLHEDGSIEWHNPRSGEHIIFVASDGELTGDIQGHATGLDNIIPSYAK